MWAHGAGTVDAAVGGEGAEEGGADLAAGCGGEEKVVAVGGEAVEVAGSGACMTPMWTSAWGSTGRRSGRSGRGSRGSVDAAELDVSSPVTADAVVEVSQPAA